MHPLIVCRFWPAADFDYKSLIVCTPNSVQLLAAGRLRLQNGKLHIIRDPGLSWPPRAPAVMSPGWEGRRLGIWPWRPKVKKSEKVIKSDLPLPDIRLGLAGPISWAARAQALLPPGWEGRRLGICRRRPKVIKKWKSNKKLKCLRQT